MTKKQTLRRQIQLLSMMDVFESLDREELKEATHQMPDTHLQEGEIFHTPEDEQERLFILKKGGVQVYEVTPDGKELTLSIVQGGSILGEMALTGQSLAGVYLRAKEPSVVATLERKDLEALILSNPELGLILVRILAKQLKEAQVRLAELTHKDVPARLASQILRFADDEGIKTNEGIKIATRYSHEQLAAMIGSGRVAVSRSLSNFRKKGIVESRARHIYVKDPKALQRIAEGNGEDAMQSKRGRCNAEFVIDVENGPPRFR